MAQPSQPLPVHSVETWPIGRVKPYERNPRRHPAEQIQQLRGSVKKFGQVWPILVRPDGTMVAGHGRLEALKAEGFTGVKVIVAAGWSEEQCRAFGLLDNKVALNSVWDEAALGMELADLSTLGVGLGDLGFSVKELGELLGGNAGECDPEDTPAPQERPISRTGDLWVLGKHRLLCGDATNEVAVRRLLNGQSVEMILTDPPYCSGGFQEARKSAGSVGTRGTEMIANDTLSTRGYMALVKAVIPQFGAGVVYVFTDWRMWINLFDVIESSGYGVRNMIVWDKGTPGMGVGWRMQHELIICGISVKSPFNPKKAQGNVIQSKRTGNNLHATEKPVDLLETIINVTDMAKTVADPFLGSGTTLIAAEMTGRVCYGMEIAPVYVDVAVRRWQKFTGQNAILEGTTRSFEHVEQERAEKVAEHA